MEELKQIKKYYGEAMMRFCRDNFSSILEKKGLLIRCLLEHFEPSKELYNDLIKFSKLDKFKNYIYFLFDKKMEVKETTKTPEELLASVGYKLYHCETEEQIQYFKKYYMSDELLCTFNGGRLRSCHVFFAVKDNALELNRNDFKNPSRQDEYGTSVISIQFSRGSNNVISIKNRYNHAVVNPDATFSNNLDNIIEGLTKSFEHSYKFNLSSSNIDFEMPGYVMAENGKFYKYNYEYNNVYYCPNNIIIDNYKLIERYRQKERYIIFEHFILDLKEKTIKLYDDIRKDSFISAFENIEKIEVNKDKYGNKQIKIYMLKQEPVIMVLDKFNNLKKYINNNLIAIDDYFLAKNVRLEYIELNNVEKIGNSFLLENGSLKNIRLPKVKVIGNNFMYYNTKLDSIYMPKVKQIGDFCLYFNMGITAIYFDNLEIIGNSFFCLNTDITMITLPKCRILGNSCFKNNIQCHTLSLLAVQSIGDDFMKSNLVMENIYLPKALYLGSNFFYQNTKMKKLYMPKVEVIKDSFLFSNNCLDKILLPNCRIIGSRFIFCNEIIKEVYLPKVIEIDFSFLSGNIELEELELNNVINIGSSFMFHNQKLKKLSLPVVENIESDFLMINTNLRYVIMPQDVKMNKNPYLQANEHIINICFNSKIKQAIITNIRDKNFKIREKLIQKVKSF